MSFKSLFSFCMLWQLEGKMYKLFSGCFKEMVAPQKSILWNIESLGKKRNRIIFSLEKKKNSSTA